MSTHYKKCQYNISWNIFVNSRFSPLAECWVVQYSTGALLQLSPRRRQERESHPWHRSSQLVLLPCRKFERAAKSGTHIESVCTDLRNSAQRVWVKRELAYTRWLHTVNWQLNELSWEQNYYGLQGRRSLLGWGTVTAIMISGYPEWDVKPAPQAEQPMTAF